jgi:hypothetical protein
MDPKPKSHAAEYAIGAGYVIWICLAITVCSAFYYFTYLQPLYSPINPFATSLPPLTPIPHVPSASEQASENTVIEAFDDNTHQWAHSDRFSKIEVKKGKLVIESLQEGSTAPVACDAELCTPGDEAYFLQADFSTDVETDQGFGILFNQLNSGEHFFLFEISATKAYRLYHRTADGWSIRLGGESDLIKAFPAVNTLGIYVNKDTVEFYINGKVVDSYSESGRSFQIGQIGFSASNSGFKLLVDNFRLSR